MKQTPMAQGLSFKDIGILVNIPQKFFKTPPFSISYIGQSPIKKDPAGAGPLSSFRLVLCGTKRNV